MNSSAGSSGLSRAILADMYHLPLMSRSAEDDLLVEYSWIGRLWQGARLRGMEGVDSERSRNYTPSYLLSVNIG